MPFPLFATARALAVVVVTTLACHTTKVVPLDQASGRSSVLLTLSDESEVVLYDPQISGTKVVGFVGGIYREFPTSKVKQVQVREPAGTRTAALAAVGLLGFAGVCYAILAGSSKGGGTDYCDAPEHYNEPICQ